MTDWGYSRKGRVHGWCCHHCGGSFRGLRSLIEHQIRIGRKLPGDAVTDARSPNQGLGVVRGGSQPIPSELNDSRERPAPICNE